VGTAGSTSSADESVWRWSHLASGLTAVVSAARENHPYEEPLITVTEVSIARGDARMGRVSELPEPVTLPVFAKRVAAGCSE
jgi:hypothetical protein